MHINGRGVEMLVCVGREGKWQTESRGLNEDRLERAAESEAAQTDARVPETQGGPLVSERLISSFMWGGGRDSKGTGSQLNTVKREHCCILSLETFFCQ